jgi:hypothetical protein
MYFELEIVKYKFLPSNPNFVQSFLVNKSSIFLGLRRPHQYSLSLARSSFSHTFDTTISIGLVVRSMQRRNTRALITPVTCFSFLARPNSRHCQFGPTVAVAAAQCIKFSFN